MLLASVEPRLSTRSTAQQGKVTPTKLLGFLLLKLLLSHLLRGGPAVVGGAAEMIVQVVVLFLCFHFKGQKNLISVPN